jgi:ABC-2 type transport system permease protein
MIEILEESYAVALRDMRKVPLWKSALSLLILVSILFLVGLGFDRIISNPFFIGYSEFFTYGMIFYFVLMIGLGQGSDIIFDHNNYVKLLLVAPISKYSILLGKTISLFRAVIPSYLVIGMVFLLINQKVSYARVIVLFFFIMLLVITGVSLGLFLSTLTQNRKTSQQIVQWTGFFILFLSGIFFPVSVLPELLQKIFIINPLVYYVDLFRYLMSGSSVFLPFVSLIVSIAFSSFVIVFGIINFERNLRR